MLGNECVASYRDFATSASAIGHALTAKFGINPGDRVGIYMSNRPEYLELLYAVWWAGAVVVPINAKLHKNEAKWILQHAQASLLFVAGSQQEQHDNGLADENLGMLIISVLSTEYSALKESTGSTTPSSRSGDDAAWLFYTSGTTGRPKGVMLTNDNLVAMSLCYLADVGDVQSEDAIYYAAPMSHGAGLYNFIHVRLAARHAFPTSKGFNADEIISASETIGNLSFFAAPTMVNRLIETSVTRNYQGEGIKLIVYGGGPMYRADIEKALDQFGNRFVQIYGQGESPMTISSLTRQEHQTYLDSEQSSTLSSVGKAHSCVDIRITGEDGSPIDIGSAGEIEVRGATVMKGYWRDTEATTNNIVDGWLKTGDIGKLDQNGFLTLTDRSKDVIISGGTNIYPREVEEVLLLHPEVLEASVVGKPDLEWGEIVVAFVVSNNVSEAELEQWCLNHIARFKRPKMYQFTDALPKNHYGKIVKSELRAKL